MALLYSVFGFLPTPSSSDPESFDVISALPFEMAIAILRLLPGKDLLNAACTSSRWLSLCRSDKQLRRTIRRHLKRLARQRMRAIITDNIGGRRGRTSYDNSIQEAPRAVDGVLLQDDYRFRKSQMTSESANLRQVRGSVSRVHRYSPYRRDSAKPGGSRAEPESGNRMFFRM